MNDIVRLPVVNGRPEARETSHLDPLPSSGARGRVRPDLDPDPDSGPEHDLRPGPYPHRYPRGWDRLPAVVAA